MSENMIHDIFENMCTQFVPERAATDKAVIAFAITGENAGTYFARVDNGTCETGIGLPTTGDPDITISSDSADFIALVTGKLSPIVAMTTGKVKIKGPMGMAMKFAQWFKLG